MCVHVQKNIRCNLPHPNTFGQKKSYFHLTYQCNSDHEKIYSSERKLDSPCPRPSLVGSCQVDLCGEDFCKEPATDWLTLMRLINQPHDLIPTSLITAIRGWKKFWNIYCGVLAATSPLQALISQSYHHCRHDNYCHYGKKKAHKSIAVLSLKSRKLLSSNNWHISQWNIYDWPKSDTLTSFLDFELLSIASVSLW